MIKKAIRMRLYPGYEKEYEIRHQQLWPEMRELLTSAGVTNYAIFLDSETNALFGYLEITDLNRWQAVGETEINRKWWDYMADIMETNPDNSPVTVELNPVFQL
ncbi:MAG: L-rhamnose mutarotase [Enterococcus sp.]